MNPDPFQSLVRLWRLVDGTSCEVFSSSAHGYELRMLRGASLLRAERFTNVDAAVDAGTRWQGELVSTPPVPRRRRTSAPPGFPSLVE